MSTLNNKIECLKRLIRLGHHHDLVQWLVEYKILTLDELKANSRSEQSTSELIYFALNKACKEEKILLLDYEWTILPKEYIKILIVTEKESQTFNYGI